MGIVTIYYKEKDFGEIDRLLASELRKSGVYCTFLMPTAAGVPRS
jgi:hypothetical protein